MNIFSIICIGWICSILGIYAMRHHNIDESATSHNKSLDIREHIVIVLLAPIVFPIGFIAFVLYPAWEGREQNSNIPKPVKKKKRKQKDEIIVGGNIVPLAEYNYRYRKSVTLDQIYGKKYVRSLTSQEINDMETVLDCPILFIQKNLPDSDYKKAAIILGKSLIENQYSEVQKILDTNVSFVLYGEHILIGIDNFMTYWKEWYIRIKKDCAKTKFRVQYSPNVGHIILSVSTVGAKQMYVLFRMNKGLITDIILAPNPLQGKDYRSLDEFPYSLDFFQLYIGEKLAVESNRMFCFECGMQSHHLDWYKVHFNGIDAEYWGVASICPRCNRVVEYYFNEYCSYDKKEKKVKDNIARLKGCCNDGEYFVDDVEKFTPTFNCNFIPKIEGIANFYCKEVLLGTSYTDCLSQETSISVNFLKKKYSLKDIAERCNWGLLNQLLNEDRHNYDLIKGCYQSALDDGIYEAANVLAILLYNFEEQRERGISLFEIAIQHGSSTAALNLFSVYWSERKYEAAVKVLLDTKDSPISSIYSLWNLAFLKFYGKDYLSNPLERDVDEAKNYLQKIIVNWRNSNDEDDKVVVENARQFLHYMSSVNTYSIKGVSFHRVLKSDIVPYYENSDKISKVFTILTHLRLKEGYKLGLKLAARHEGALGDISRFYICNDSSVEDYNLIKYLQVEISEMAAWEIYLLMTADTNMPVVWHGGYIKRNIIFGYDDLYKVDRLKVKDFSLLHKEGILLPKVCLNKLKDSDRYSADVYCCYWNEWKGLIREHINIQFRGNNILSYEHVEDFVIYSYHCGIYF